MKYIILALLFIGCSKQPETSISYETNIEKQVLLEVASGDGVYGSVLNTDANITKVITIKNNGDEATPSAPVIEIVGANASDYSVIYKSPTCLSAIKPRITTCQIKVLFSPKNKSGEYLASLNIDSLAIPLSATVSSPSVEDELLVSVDGVEVEEINFGLTTSTAQKTVEIKNNSPANLSLTTAQLVGSDFSILNNYCTNKVLKPNQTCTLKLLFDPRNKVNPIENSLSLNNQTILVKAQVQVAPTSLTLEFLDGLSVIEEIDFGVVTSSVTKIINVRNNGTIPTNALTVMPLTDYTLVTNSCTGKKLAVNASCQVRISFSKGTKNPGIYATDLLITSGAVSSTLPLSAEVVGAGAYYNLTINYPINEGIIISDGNQIICNNQNTSTGCSASYPAGTNVNLSISYQPYINFSNWIVNSVNSGNSPVLSFVLNENKTVSVNAEILNYDISLSSTEGGSFKLDKDCAGVITNLVDTSSTPASPPYQNIFSVRKDCVLSLEQNKLDLTEYSIFPESLGLPGEVLQSDRSKLEASITVSQNENINLGYGKYAKISSPEITGACLTQTGSNALNLSYDGCSNSGGGDEGGGGVNSSASLEVYYPLNEQVKLALAVDNFHGLELASPNSVIDAGHPCIGVDPLECEFVITKNVSLNIAPSEVFTLALSSPLSGQLQYSTLVRTNGVLTTQSISSPAGGRVKANNSITVELVGTDSQYDIASFSTQGNECVRSGSTCVISSLTENTEVSVNLETSNLLYTSTVGSHIPLTLQDQGTLQTKDPVATTDLAGVVSNKYKVGSSATYSLLFSTTDNLVKKISNFTESSFVVNELKYFIALIEKLATKIKPIYTDPKIDLVNSGCVLIHNGVVLDTVSFSQYEGVKCVGEHYFPTSGVCTDNHGNDFSVYSENGLNCSGNVPVTYQVNLNKNETIQESVPFNNKVYFVKGEQFGLTNNIWVYDPALNMSDTNPSLVLGSRSAKIGGANFISKVSNITPYGNYIYFIGDAKLFRVDITQSISATNPTQVSNFTVSYSSMYAMRSSADLNPLSKQFAIQNGKIYFHFMGKPLNGTATQSFGEPYMFTLANAISGSNPTLLKEIYTGDNSTGSLDESFKITPLNATWFTFPCSYPSNGIEFCISDGTSANTLTKSIRAGTASSTPAPGVSAGTFYYFCAYKNTARSLYRIQIGAAANNPAEVYASGLNWCTSNVVKDDVNWVWFTGNTATANVHGLYVFNPGQAASGSNPMLVQTFPVSGSNGVPSIIERYGNYILLGLGSTSGIYKLEWFDWGNMGLMPSDSATVKYTNRIDPAYFVRSLNLLYFPYVDAQTFDEQNTKIAIADLNDFNIGGSSNPAQAHQFTSEYPESILSIDGFFRLNNIFYGLGYDRSVGPTLYKIDNSQP